MSSKPNVSVYVHCVLLHLLAKVRTVPASWITEGTLLDNLAKEYAEMFDDGHKNMGKVPETPW